MKIISFAKTTPALLMGAKTMTRRYWADRYALTFKRGDVCQAWNWSPRTKKIHPDAQKVAEVWLIKAPYKQRTSLMTESDFEREGFAFMEENGMDIEGQNVRRFFDEWKAEDSEPWVIEFAMRGSSISTADPPVPVVLKRVRG